MPEPITLSVIVPVFNERITVRKLLDRVRAVPIRKEIVIIDDGSTDGTAAVLHEFAAAHADDANNVIRVIVHERNAGKGAAIRTGIAHVTGDITLFQDADLEYSPEEYPSLIAPILAGDAEVVFGSRFLGGARRVLFYRHTVGNRLLTFLSNLGTDLNLTDMETCYKVFRTDILRQLPLVSNRFGIEPEITAKIARLGCRIFEVPISYHGREYWEGKKIGWKDGVAAIWTILKYTVVDDRENADPRYKTLQRLRHTQRYTEWLWSQVAPHVGDRVLEVGCGVGTFTRYLRNRELAVATDTNEQYLQIVRRRLEHHDNIVIRQVNWTDPSLDGLRDHQFDTILCLNVLEHIENDDAALATFAALLAPGGRLIVQVPALHGLFGHIDQAIGHFRRYDRREFSAKLTALGFELTECRYFNLPGVVGWWVNSVMLRRRTVPGIQARIANLLVPWFRLERRWQPPWGMSLFVVARKVHEVAPKPLPFVITPAAG